jgi:excisionase family DNA binding protein
MDSDMGGRKYLRAGELAKYLGVSKATLAKQRCMGGGIPFTRLGRCVVYKLDEVEIFLTSRKRDSTSGAEPR